MKLYHRIAEIRVNLLSIRLDEIQSWQVPFIHFQGRVCWTGTPEKFHSPRRRTGDMDAMIRISMLLRYGRTILSRLTGGQQPHICAYMTVFWGGKTRFKCYRVKYDDEMRRGYAYATTELMVYLTY